MHASELRKYAFFSFLAVFISAALPSSVQAGPLAQLANSYRQDYIIQRSLPANTSAADRARLEQKIFAPAFQAIGQDMASKYANFMNLENQFIRQIRKNNKHMEELGVLPGMSQEDRKKKIAELIASGKLKANGAALGDRGTASGPGKSGPGRDKAAEAEGSDGAHSVDFGGKAVPKRSKDGVLDF